MNEEGGKESKKEQHGRRKKIKKKEESRKGRKKGKLYKGEVFFQDKRKEVRRIKGMKVKDEIRVPKMPH